MLERLKERWGIESNWQILIIFIVFGLTGSSSVYVRKFITGLMGLDKELTSPWIYYPVVFIVVFICYQFLLIGYGALFGQFKFFWAFEKKMLKRFGIKL